MKHALLCLLLLLPACPRAGADTRALVTQSTPTDCGPAALATLLRYYLDVPTTEAEMMRLAKYDHDRGTTLAGLEAAAGAKGCAADSFLMTYSTLREQITTFPAPVIVRMLNPEPHFAVVLAIDQDNVYLADPAHGNIALPKESFRRRWYVPESAQGFVFIAAAPGQRVDRDRLARTVNGLKRGVQTLEESRAWAVTPRP